MTTFTDNLQLVDFSKIDLTDLKAQIFQGLQEGEALLSKLDAKPTAPTSQQALADIIEFDHADLTLGRNWGLMWHLKNVMDNDEVRHVHHELLPIMSEYSTKVGQNLAFFNRYQQVIEDKAFFEQLEPARQRSLLLAKQGFELSGVALPEAKKAEFAQLMTQLSSLCAKFSDNLLDATQSYFLPLTQEQLKGLPETALALLADAGARYREKTGNTPPTDYVATLDIPVYIAVMTYADDRALRETLYQAYVTRASEQSDKLEFNNADIMQDILAKRLEEARLLGFNNFAELSLATKMADDVPTVERFLRDLADKARPFAEKDLQALKEAGNTQGVDEIKPWDTSYLAEKVRQRKFNLSEEAVRPYFPLPTVMSGLFEIVNRLYDIRIVNKTQHTQRWQDDVSFYEVYNDNNQLIGGFYFDLYARQGKQGGAWMDGFQARYQHDDSQYQQLPVCFMVCNFSPALGGKPSLLTHDEVITLFHEFGHGLHHLLTEVSVGNVAGTNGVEWDAVELPSQFMENWAWHPEGIALISGHVDTGETLPDDMLKAMLNAKNFQSGMQTLRQIEFALFDLLLHATTPAPNYAQLLALLDEVRGDVAVMPAMPYNRFANSFSHIFSGGYASGYYSYKWAELLSADAFSKFEETAIFDKAMGNAFRTHVLAKGGSDTAKNNFERFMGREANIDALLRHSGFVETVD